MMVCGLADPRMRIEFEVYARRRNLTGYVRVWSPHRLSTVTYAGLSTQAVARRTRRRKGGRMRRLLLLAPLLLFTVGCGLVQPAEGEATDAAREVARKAGERLYSQRPRTAEEVGRSASGIEGVEVLRVTGTSTHDGDGVDVVVRTSGSAYYAQGSTLRRSSCGAVSRCGRRPSRSGARTPVPWTARMALR